jgi:hypothetical protein
MGTDAGTADKGRLHSPEQGHDRRGPCIVFDARERNYSRNIGKNYWYCQLRCLPSAIHSTA